jgi:hypothetical protein
MWQNGSSNQSTTTVVTVPTDQWLILEVDLGFERKTLRLLDLQESELTTAFIDHTGFSGDLYWQTSLRSGEDGAHLYSDEITQRPV